MTLNSIAEVMSTPRHNEVILILENHPFCVRFNPVTSTTRRPYDRQNLPT